MLLTAAIKPLVPASILDADNTLVERLRKGIDITLNTGREQKGALDTCIIAHAESSSPYLPLTQWMYAHIRRHTNHTFRQQNIPGTVLDLHDTGRQIAYVVNQPLIQIDADPTAWPREGRVQKKQGYIWNAQGHFEVDDSKYGFIVPVPFSSIPKRGEEFKDLSPYPELVQALYLMDIQEYKKFLESFPAGSYPPDIKIHAMRRTSPSYGGLLAGFGY